MHRRRRGGGPACRSLGYGAVAAAAAVASSRAPRGWSRCSRSARTPRKEETLTSGGPVGSARDYRKGPVTLRRSLVPHSTTDQRLLDSRGSTDWLHTDPWRVLRIQAEFVEGFGALAELGPAISVFGSARTPRTDPEYALAERLGAALVE